MTREATVERNTKETKIAIKLNLDGTGKSSLDTGVGFFDHMLDGFTRHGLFDLEINVKGDLQVDDHHTIEDTGIVLGTAIKEAVGDKKGIRRYGSCILPMDECLVLCAIDLGGSCIMIAWMTDTYSGIPNSLAYRWITWHGCTVILVTDACVAVFARVAYLERRLSGSGYVCFDMPVTDLDTTVFQFAGEQLVRFPHHCLWHVCTQL